jgi:NitT/TauT family transport system substrate-binding protein
MRYSSIRIFILALLFYCTGVPANYSLASRPLSEIRIAITGELGLIYAPMLIAAKLQIFQKYGLKPLWQSYDTEIGVRHALISDEADIGYIGIPSSLIGWDQGCPWRIAIGSTAVPLGLVTNVPEFRHLKDLKVDDKIGVPALYSVEHILLAMAAEKELGLPRALDLNLKVLSHPRAIAALIAKQDLVAHFAIPPYLFEEYRIPGLHSLINDSLILGLPFCYNVGVASLQFHNSKPLQYFAFIKAIDTATSWLNHNMRAAALLLAPDFKLAPEKALQYMTWSRMEYTTKLYGIMQFAYFLKRTGFIKKIPRSYSEIAWENAHL